LSAQPRAELQAEDLGLSCPIQPEFDFEPEGSARTRCIKLDTLIAALRVFRAGIEAEQAEYERRERELAEQKGE
jgi:hypothetical protein